MGEPCSPYALFAKTEKAESFPFPESSLPVKGAMIYRCFSQISKTEISAGLMPLMRDACPRFAGRIAASFCAASSLSPLMDS